MISNTALHITLHSLVIAQLVLHNKYTRNASHYVDSSRLGLIILVDLNLKSNSCPLSGLVWLLKVYVSFMA